MTIELLRAVGALVLLPLRLAGQALIRKRLTRALAADLESACEPDPAPAPRLSAERPLRVFLSCAEPSGEIHARSLVAALRRLALEQGAPAPEFVGLGGQRLAADGVELVGDPVSRAAMGFGVVGALPFYLGLLRRSLETLRSRPVDVLIAVDSPALHVPLGRLARGAGVKVVHFVTPQYWGWMPWRVRGYARAVDRALSILPFEPSWFRRHGILTAHVGHPIQDALAAIPANPDPDRGRTLVLLPGSRESVMRRNLPWMLEVLGDLRREHPELEVVLPHDRPELEPLARELIDAAGASEWVQVRFGELHAQLAGARAAFSVSGTVLLDLLHHRLPTVVVYRLHSALESALAPALLTVPYFSSVNLLTGRETCPEFHFFEHGPREATLAALEAIWSDAPTRARIADELELARRRLGGPGAVDRAAAWAAQTALEGQQAPRA